MSQLESAALFTVLGSFIGAILNPISDVFFSRFFGQTNEKYSFKNGLILLSGANAMWLIGFYIRYLEHSEVMIYLQGVFYLFSLFLFLGAYGQIVKSDISKHSKAISNSIVLLIGGDFFWLLAESIEFLEPFNVINEKVYYLWKIILLSLSALIFSLGLLYFLTIKINNLLTKRFTRTRKTTPVR